MIRCDTKKDLELFDKYVNGYFKSKKLQERIDKAIEYIKLNIRDIDYDTEEYDYLMQILGGKE